MDPVDCHNLALRRAARRVNRMYEAHLAPLGITGAQFSLLRSLARNPASTMVALATRMEMDRTTLLRALKPLQRDKLVVARPDPADSRRQLLSLTDKGRALQEASLPLWRAAQLEFEATFGKDRAAHLRDELRAVVSTK